MWHKGWMGGVGRRSAGKARRVGPASGPGAPARGWARRAYGWTVERMGVTRAFIVRGAYGLGATVLLAGGAVLLAGCSSGGAGAGTSGASEAVGSGATCGTTRTAADVPVVIKVVEGTVSCTTALRIENEYAAMIRDGQVAGNGGGAPVTISGWTCQGYNTPDLLKTGDASQCHTGTAMILAVLPVPTPTAS
jgi:hypothetical protein